MQCRITEQEIIMSLSEPMLSVIISDEVIMLLLVTLHFNELDLMSILSEIYESVTQLVGISVALPVIILLYETMSHFGQIRVQISSISEIGSMGMVEI
jgi:hypothetical protein